MTCTGHRFFDSIFTSLHVQFPEAAHTVPVVEIADGSGFGVIGEDDLCCGIVNGQVGSVIIYNGVIVKPFVGNDDVRESLRTIFPTAEYGIVNGLREVCGALGFAKQGAHNRVFVEMHFGAKTKVFGCLNCSGDPKTAEKEECNKKGREEVYDEAD